MRSLFKTVLVPALCLGALVIDTAATIKRADLMPDGAIQLRITGAKTLRGDFNQAFGERLLNAGRFQNFSTAFAEKLRRKAADGKAPFEIIQVLEILKHLEGEILFTQTSAGESEDGLVCLAATATKEVQDLILERTEWLHRQNEQHFTRLRAEFQNTPLTHDIINGGTTNETHLWMGLEGTTLLVGNDRTWLERSIVNLQKSGLPDEPDSSGLNLTLPIGKWSRESLEKLAPEKAIERKNLLQTLGLWNLGTYQIGLSFEEGNMVFDGVLTSSDLESGLFTLLDLSPEEHADNRTIPTDATSFTCGKLNLKQFWQNLPTILQGIPPEKRLAFAGAITLFQQRSGLSVEHDLLAHLGERYTLSTVMMGTNQTMVVALELTDGNALEESIAKLLASPFAAKGQDLIEAKDFRGHTLFAVKNKINPEAGPTLCVTPGWLILGMKGDLTRDIILRLDAADAPRPGSLEANARSHAPAAAFGLGGMNHQETSGILNVSVTDSTFNAGFGFSSKRDRNKETPPAENEISLRYLTTFLGNTYHFAEAVPGGIHHRLIFENVKSKGTHP